MNHSPLKTALAYECFPDQDNSTLALPSDQKMKTGTSGRQRVQEQVMMTVKRQKSKSSQSSTLSHSNRGKGSVPARPVRYDPAPLGGAAGTQRGAPPGSAGRRGSAWSARPVRRGAAAAVAGDRLARAPGWGCEGGLARRVGDTARGASPARRG